jgi:hypothetical protein
MAMDSDYTLEKAAALLGVKLETLEKKIAQGLIVVHDEGQKKLISRDEIIKLYGNISDDDENPDKAKNKEQKPNGSRRNNRTLDKLPKGTIVVEDEEAVRLSNERDKVHDRILAMMEHIERLNYRISQYNAIEKGKNAEFWKRVGVLYPDKINYKTNYSAEIREDKLIIYPIKGDQSDDGLPKKIQLLISRIKESNMPPQVKDLMISTIRGGTLPPKEIIKAVGLDPSDYYDDDE